MKVAIGARARCAVGGYLIGLARGLRMSRYKEQHTAWSGLLLLRFGVGLARPFVLSSPAWAKAPSTAEAIVYKARSIKLLLRPSSGMTVHEVRGNKRSVLVLFVFPL